MKVSCEKGYGRRMLDVLRSAVWLVLLLAQARLEVLARLRRNDLLLRGKARQVSSVDDRPIPAYHRPMLQGATEHLDDGSRLALLRA